MRWIFTYRNERTSVLAAEGLVATLQALLADIALHHPVLIKSTIHVNIDVIGDATDDVNEVEIDDSEPELFADVTLSADFTGSEARGRFLIATCFQLLHAVHVRPPADLHALIEPMFKAGLSHKLFIGRPYEEAAGLLDDAHYARCAAALRPESSAQFMPAAPAPLAASTRVGAGYRPRRGDPGHPRAV